MTGFQVVPMLNSSPFESSPIQQFSVLKDSPFERSPFPSSANLRHHVVVRGKPRRREGPGGDPPPPSGRSSRGIRDPRPPGPREDVNADPAGAASSGTFLRRPTPSAPSPAKNNKPVHPAFAGKDAARPSRRRVITRQSRRGGMAPERSRGGRRQAQVPVAASRRRGPLRLGEVE